MGPMARCGLSRKRTHGSAVPQRGRASPSVSGTVGLPRAPTRASITSLCMVARRPADAVMRVYFIRTSRRGIMRYKIQSHTFCSQSFLFVAVHISRTLLHIFRSRAHTGPRSAAGTASTEREGPKAKRRQRSSVSPHVSRHAIAKACKGSRKVTRYRTYSCLISSVVQPQLVHCSLLLYICTLKVKRTYQVPKTRPNPCDMAILAPAQRDKSKASSTSFEHRKFTKHPQRAPMRAPAPPANAAMHPCARLAMQDHRNKYGSPRSIPGVAHRDRGPAN